MTTSRPRVLHVVGARPNFMKVAPILRAMEESCVSENVLLHTGQHYDDDMSESFFRDLGFREPDVRLGVGSGSHGRQTAAVLQGVEDVLLADRFACVVVVGDVNSTLAASLAAVKLGVPVVHVEAGLRSGDRTMPEEINRILTDQISALCLTPSADARTHLNDEGIPDDRIVFVGNVMIDTLLATLERSDGSSGPWGDEPRGSFVVATLHRPSNVDDPDQLFDILAALEAIAERVPVFFPIHPRTAKAMTDAGARLNKVRRLPPLGYGAMVDLQSRAGLVLTDSGGIQEETTVLGVRCLTLRSSTERPITITQGTNTLVPLRSTEAILAAFDKSWGIRTSVGRPDGWDGRAALRIREAIHQLLGVG